MTKHTICTGPLSVVLPLLVACSGYTPLYGGVTHGARSAIFLERFEEKGVSGLEDALYHELQSVFVVPQSSQPSYRLSGHIRLVDTTLSPVRSDTPTLRAYQIRTKLEVALTDVASQETIRAKFERESDFTLARGDGDDLVLDTELNRRKALRRLARKCSTDIQQFVFRAIAEHEEARKLNSVDGSQ